MDGAGCFKKIILSFCVRSATGEAVTRRFFRCFLWDSRRGTESEIAATLNSYAQTAKKYLYQCGNEVVISDNPTQDRVEMLYLLLNAGNQHHSLSFPAVKSGGRVVYP